MMTAMGSGSNHALRRPAAGAPPVISGERPELLGSADVAKVLGVSEADVLSRSKKGRTQGQENRLHLARHKASLDEF